MMSLRGGRVRRSAVVAMRRAWLSSSAAESGKVVDVRSAKELQGLLSADGTTIVDCWAEWCGPCRTLTPVLVNAVLKTEGVRLAKVNVDESEIAETLGVSAIPAVFAYYQGKQIASFVGFPGEDKVKTWVSNVAKPVEILDYLNAKGPVVEKD